MIEIIGKPKFESKSSIIQIANDCVEKLNINSGTIVEILFVDQEKMKQLNLIHRKIDKPTDVLSFPQDKTVAENNILGSIVICEEIAHEMNESDCSLVQHGFLHLMGYDHETNINKWREAEKLIR